MKGQSVTIVTPSASSVVEIRRKEILSPLVDRLITALNRELEDRYPEEGANYFDLDADEVADGRGAFLVAFLANEPIGCGAARRISPTVYEIKRMYVAQGARNRGVGRRILNELESIARALGAARLVLETGVRQPEALALYMRAGFTTIPLFGNYADTPHPELSVCMAKELRVNG
jgi:GNAT superfamily N-acetyltransferase